MKVLTEDAILLCNHVTGKVRNTTTQDWVTIQGRRMLVENNPEGRTIVGCSNISPVMKPCLLTLRVEEGYSGLVRIDGQPICLDTVTGLTDGTPPGTVKYTVRNRARISCRREHEQPTLSRLALCAS